MKKIAGILAVTLLTATVLTVIGNEHIYEGHEEIHEKDIMGFKSKVKSEIEVFKTETSSIKDHTIIYHTYDPVNFNTAIWRMNNEDHCFDRVFFSAAIFRAL